MGQSIYLLELQMCLVRLKIDIKILKIAGDVMITNKKLFY